MKRVSLASLAFFTLSACVFAGTATPFTTNQPVTIKTRTGSVTGTVKDSSNKEWVVLVEQGSKQEVWVPVRAIEYVSKSLPSGASNRPVREPGSAPRPNKCIVYVHGICEHPKGYSAEMYKSLAPYLSNASPIILKEVYWSDVISNAPGGQANNVGVNTVSAAIKDRLVDRIEQQKITALDDPNPNAPGGALDRIPLVNCIDGFAYYLLKPDSRRQILDRFHNTVDPLLAEDGADVEIISHSWGTVVAYEGLRELDGSAQRSSIHTLFSVGSALHIPEVKRRLLPIAADGRRPDVVQLWVNLNARFDVVGGSLRADGYAVDVDKVNLATPSCSRIVPNPVCAHGSYFETGNVVVNRDYFAFYILR